MTFDSQEQKDLVILALNVYPVQLGQAHRVLRLAEAITKGEIVPPKQKKVKK